jgi:predicted AAA+ superfamily ATPase
MIHDEELKSSVDYSEGQKQAAHRVLVELVNLFNRKKKCFIQVAYYLSGQQTIDREFGAFKPISDASPKYVLSMDRLDFSRDGISHINIVDFLLGKKELMLT